MTLTKDEMTGLVLWPEGSVGADEEIYAYELLHSIGEARGFGALAQMAQWLCDVKLYGKTDEAWARKAAHFELMGWVLPEREAKP